MLVEGKGLEQSEEELVSREEIFLNSKRSLDHFAEDLPG